MSSNNHHGGAIAIVKFLGNNGSDARFAYAKTLGRPDYANIIPNTDVNEDDSDPNAAGVITIRNTQLKPWTANNYDFSLEYYFAKSGLASVGVFKKDLTGFFVGQIMKALKGKGNPAVVNALLKQKLGGG